MIRRSPSEKYLVYLLSHPDVRSVEELRDHFLELQLPWLGNLYVDRLRAKMELPDPFYPYERQHRPSIRWLLSTGVFDLYHPTEAVYEAQQLLEHPRAKEYVEALLITHVPLINIQDGLARKYSFRMSIAGLERYKYFYYNVDLVDTTEMRALLQYQDDVAKKHADVDVAAQGRFLERARYGDARRVAANMPHSPYTSMVAQMRLGALPYRLNFAQILEAIQNAAAIKALEIVQGAQGGMQAALDASSYMNMAIKAKEASKELVDPTQALHEQLNAVRLRTQVQSIVTIHDLSNGQHTAELAPPTAVKVDMDVPLDDIEDAKDPTEESIDDLTGK